MNSHSMKKLKNENKDFLILCKILIKKKKKYLFFAYEYNDMKNFFSKISYTNIKKRFYSNTE